MVGGGGDGNAAHAIGNVHRVVVAGNGIESVAAYSLGDGLKIARSDGMVTLARTVAILRNGEESVAKSMLHPLANDGAEKNFPMQEVGSSTGRNK
jgi:hypothetical protein